MGVLLLMFVMGTKIKPVFQSELDEKYGMHNISFCISDSLCAYAMHFVRRCVKVVR